MKRSGSGLLIFSLIALFFAIGCGDKRIKIEKLDDLPRYTYTIADSAVSFVMDRDAVMALADQIRNDMESDLETYRIEDKTTLKSYYSSLGIIALLEKKYDSYLDYLKKVKALEEKEAVKMTMDLSKAYVEAMQVDEVQRHEVYQTALRKIVNAMPFEIVGDEIKSAKGRSEIFSTNLVLGMMNSQIQPILEQTEGVVSKDIALSFVYSHYRITEVMPFKQDQIAVYSAYIEENEKEKEDIWEARSFEVKEGEGQDVVIAIWDSGVDTKIFTKLDKMWINTSEIPDNGIDDDKNGFVDDYNGIAYTLHADKTSELLFPIGSVQDRPRLQRMMKGLTDIQSNVDSEEASELKGALSQLQQTEVQPFVEDISKYGNYSHGTHVSGIAANGNEHARLLASRLTFGYKMIPEEPTIEFAEKEAKMYKETIAYYKQNNVRVVNMSWGGSLASIESALEANNAGGTPDERKELARKIFDIGRNGLFEAIESAPEILFVTSAGNSDNDVNFEEFIPSSFDLPNIMSVGAVDKAGDETSFTSFGKVDVYANGFEVVSYIPGGDTMPMNGTSMSSPNVTNLAGKLFAVNPDLTALQVRDLIEDGVDVTKAGNREIRLINPKKSLDLLKKM